MGAVQRVNELVGAAEKAVDFMHANNIRVLVFTGSSVKPMDVVLRQIWRRKYGSSFPRLISLGAINKSRPYRDAYYTGKEEEKLFGIKNPHEKTLRSSGEMDVQEVVNRRFKNLLNTRKISLNDKLLVLDEHTLTAGSINDVRNAIRKLGFNNIKTGTLVKEPANVRLKTYLDFVGTSSINRALYERRRAILAKVVDSNGRLIKDRAKKSAARKKLQSGRKAVRKVTNKRKI